MIFIFFILFLFDIDFKIFFLHAIWIGSDILHCAYFPMLGMHNARKREETNDRAVKAF